MITTTTTNTKKVFSDFATSYVKNNKTVKFIYICSAIIIVCAVLILSLGDYTQGALYLCLGLFFAFYGVIVRGIVILTNKKNVDTIYTYLFEENSFNVVVNSKEGKEIANSKINYEALHSVKAYKNYGYIYVNKMSCYILIKENFDNENQFYSLLENIQSKINNSNVGHQSFSENIKVETVNKNNSSENTKEKEEDVELKKRIEKIKELEEKRKQSTECETESLDEENAIIAKIKAKNQKDKKTKK